MNPRLGVLTLQGDYEAHLAALTRAGFDPIGVRTPDRLDAIDGLIMPGGESSALLRLMAPLDFERALVAFHARGGAIFGTCAGVILLASEVEGGTSDGGSGDDGSSDGSTTQRSLGLLDVRVKRNDYGRQRESFAARVDAPSVSDEPLDAVFIRAPRIVAVGPDVEVLARYGDDAVLVRQGRILGAGFHPELTDDDRLLHYFAERVVGCEARA